MKDARTLQSTISTSYAIQIWLLRSSPKIKAWSMYINRKTISFIGCDIVNGFGKRHICEASNTLEPLIADFCFRLVQEQHAKALQVYRRPSVKRSSTTSETPLRNLPRNQLRRYMPWNEFLTLSHHNTAHEDFDRSDALQRYLTLTRGLP